VYQQLLQQLTAQRRMPPPIAGLVYNGLAEVLREWNHLDAAVEHLRHGIELCESWQPIGALDGYITLAHARHAQGDTQGAFQALTRAEQLAGQTSGMKMDDLLVAAHKARLDVRCGDLDAAIQWAQTRRLDAGRWQPSPHYYLREIEALTFVRLLLAQRRLDEALDLLGDLHRIATGLERDGIRIQVETLQALAHAAQGNLAQAAALLEQALARAGSEGYVRTFLDEGSAMRPILERVKVGSSATKGYARTLLAALEGAEGARSALPLGGPLIEPLSDRELQVLRFIADGRSNQEIADRLVVALSTVKTHINNIYAKLGVEGRVQAVNRARELGLV
jgi:LuxR family maltose regulon positive regulatory protein